ncbi:MAG: hypothetical protein AAF490_03415, partial [Chloroflexota bacterium]
MIQDAIFFGLLSSILGSIVILLSIRHEPRIWLHDVPKEIQAAVEPKTPREKRLERLWGIPFMGAMLVVPFLVALWKNQQYAFNFGSAFLFIWIVLMVFNLVDLVIIDWLVVVWWAPVWTRIKGTEYVAHYNNYWFYFVGYLKGIGITAVSA